MWNIIIGIIFVIGGLSGKLALRGTDSSSALAVIGAVLAIWGVIQMTRRKQAQAKVLPRR